MDFRASLKNQTGSALVFAMGLCTLVAILATSMIFSLNKDMRRYDRMVESVFEKTAMSSSTAWALSILSDEINDNNTEQTYSMILNGANVTMTLTEKVVPEDEASEEQETSKAYVLKTLITAKSERVGYTVLEQIPEKGWKVVEQKIGASL